MSTVRITKKFLKNYRKALTRATGLRHRSKSTSHFMRFLARRIIRSFNVSPRAFMRRFSTTLYLPFFEYPVAFYSWKLGTTTSPEGYASRLRTVAHEGVHAYQIKPDPAKFTVRYGGSSNWRTRYELEAYTVSVVISLYTDENGLRDQPLLNPPRGYTSVKSYVDSLIEFYTNTLLQNYAVSEGDAEFFESLLRRDVGRHDALWASNPALILLRQVANEQ